MILSTRFSNFSTRLSDSRNRGRATNTLEEYQHKAPLLIEICEAIRTVYEELIETMFVAIAILPEIAWSPTELYGINQLKAVTMK